MRWNTTQRVNTLNVVFAHDCFRVLFSGELSDAMMHTHFACPHIRIEMIFTTTPASTLPAIRNAHHHVYFLQGYH
jgi:hypothetical protein